MQILCRCLERGGRDDAGLLRRVPSRAQRHIPSMQIPKRIGIISVWFIGLALVFTAVNKNDPYLIWLRGAGNAVIVVASLLAVALMIRRGAWTSGGLPGRLLLLLWVLPWVSMLCAEASFEVRKWRVLNTDVARAKLLGRHFVVGYSSFDEVARLVPAHTRKSTSEDEGLRARAGRFHGRRLLQAHAALRI